MAIKKINITSKEFVSSSGCDELALCLPSDPWASRTVSGVPMIKGKVDISGRYLGSGGMPFFPQYENPRGQDRYQYTFIYDDSQLQTDPETSEPYVIDCEGQLLPYSCLADYIIETNTPAP